jgi:hypothetical protein
VSVRELVAKLTEGPDVVGRHWLLRRWRLLGEQLPQQFSVTIPKAQSRIVVKSAPELLIDLDQPFGDHRAIVAALCQAAQHFFNSI